MSNKKWNETENVSALKVKKLNLMKEVLFHLSERGYFSACTTPSFLHDSRHYTAMKLQLQMVTKKPYIYVHK